MVRGEEGSNGNTLFRPSGERAAKRDMCKRVKGTSCGPNLWGRTKSNRKRVEKGSKRTGSQKEREGRNTQAAKQAGLCLEMKKP